MKKLLPLGLIFAAVLTLGLMGCKNTPEEDDGLSGKWTNSITYIESDQFPSAYGVNGNTVTFEKTNTGSMDIEEGNLLWWHPVISTSVFTGVKVKMTCSSRNPGYGLLFVDPQDLNHYYRFSLRNGNILMEEYNNGTTKDLIFDKGNGTTYYWRDWDTKVNQEPQENEVVFYTASDGSIKLLVNNETITSIENPTIPSFYIAAIGQVSYTDKVTNTTVKATYNFVKFQTSK